MLLFFIVLLTVHLDTSV